MQTRIPDNLLRACGLIVDDASSALVKVPTTSMTSEFDCNKLASGQPPFITRKRASQDTKPKIIISDWSHQNANSEGRTKSSVYFRLFAIGYEIYIYTGELIKIESVADLHILLLRVKAIHPTELKKIAGEYGLESHKLKVLDYFETIRVSNILSGRRDVTRVLHWNDLHPIRNDHIRQSILASLDEEISFSVRIKGLFFDKNNIDFFEELLSLSQVEGLIYRQSKVRLPKKERLPKSDVLAKFDHVLCENAHKFRIVSMQLTDHHHVPDITRYCTNLESFEQSGDHSPNLRFPAPDRLKRLMLECPQVVSEIETLLPYCLQLKEVWLKNVGLSVIDRLPTSVERLTIILDKMFETFSLDLLLDKFPALQRLELDHEVNVVKKIKCSYVDDRCYEGLKELILTDIELINAHSQRAHDLFPNLETVELTDVTGMLPFTSVTPLNKICLNYSSNFEFAKKIIDEHSNTVEDLTLIGKFDREKFVVRLEKVKRLKLSHFSAEQSEVLLNLCPALEKLYLEAMEINVKSYASVKLDRLKKLSVEGAKTILSLPGLFRLINHSSQFEELIIPDFHYLTDSEKLQEVSSLNSNCLRKVFIYENCQMEKPNIFLEKLIKAKTLSTDHYIHFRYNDELWFNLHHGYLDLLAYDVEPVCLELLSILLGSVSIVGLKLRGEKVLLDLAAPVEICNVSPEASYHRVGKLLTGIKSLSLSGINSSNAKDWIPYYCPNIERLELSSDQGSHPNMLAFSPETLTDLHFEPTYLTHDNLNYIKQFRQLSRLDFGEMVLRDDSINKIMQAMQELVYAFPEINIRCSIAPNELSPDSAADLFSAGENRSLSLSTSGKNLSLNATEYFLPKKNGMPIINYICLSIVSLVEERNTAHCPIASPPCRMTPFELRHYYESVLSDKDNIFYGQRTYLAEPNKWYPLPALMPSIENMIECSADQPIEIAYSNKGRYRFKLLYLQKKMVTVSFVLSSDINIDFNIFATTEFNAVVDDKYFRLLQSMQLTQKGWTTPYEDTLAELRSESLLMRVTVLTQFFRSFTAEDLSQDTRNDFIEILNASLREKKGTCHHRAEAFYRLALWLSVDADFLSSNIHGFVRVIIGEKLKIICLGGGEGNLTITKLPSLPTPIIPKVSSREVIYQAISKNLFFQANDLSTLKTFESVAETIYRQSLILSPGMQNVLVTFSTDQQIENFFHALAYLLHREKRTCGYIPSFDQLSLKEFVVEEGKPHRIRASHIARLASESQVGDVLFVKISDYAASTVSHCNDLTESPIRKLEHIQVSPQLIIIYAITKETPIGNDVRNRCKLKVICPPITCKVIHKMQQISLEKMAEMDQNTQFDFYDGARWEERFDGTISIEGDQYFDETGFLVKVSQKQYDSLCLINPPLADEKFRLLIAEIQRTGQYSRNGETYRFHPKLTIFYASKKYKLANASYHYLVSVLSDKSTIPGDYVLNAELSSYFYRHYRCDEIGLHRSSGWLESSLKRPQCRILVTEDFPEASFAMLLDEALKKEYPLHFFFAPNVVVPEDMQSRLVPLNTDSKVSGIRVIETNDVGYAERIFLEEGDKENTLVLTVKQTTDSAALIDSIKIAQQEETFYFEHLSGAMRTALRAKQHVILKGELSISLWRRIETLLLGYLWVNGQKEIYDVITWITPHVPAELSLINVIRRMYNDSTVWNLLKTKFTQDMCEKLSALTEQFTEKAKANQIDIHFSYAQLESMLKRWQIDSHSNPFLPFILLHKKSSILIPIAESLFPGKIKEIETPDAFFAERHQMVDQTFACSPYAILVGDSGAGKTTFVSEYAKLHGYALYVGKENLKAMLESSVDSVFLGDEIGVEQAGMFDHVEGLINQTPGIVERNRFFPNTSSPQKRFFFTTNWTHYNQRQMHGLFQHGGAICFPVFPTWLLKTSVLVPILVEINQCIPVLTADRFEEVAVCFLNVYSFINQQQPKSPFTPRNLENMALRLAYLLTLDIPLTLTQKIAMAAFEEASLLPEPKIVAAFRQWTKERLAVEDVIEIANKAFTIPDSPEFILTDSRRHPLRWFGMQLGIHELKAAYPTLARFRGISGLIFEGETTIGKSVMVLAMLKAQGYQDARVDTTDHPKRYYHISSRDEDIVAEEIIRAEKENAWIYFDELSSFRFAKFLNNRNVSVIGTQNPLNYHGRLASSPAEENRFPRIPLSNYTFEELLSIAVKIGGDIPVELAAKIVRQFVDYVELAKLHHFDPPSFRQFKEKILVANASDIDINAPIAINTRAAL